MEPLVALDTSAAGYARRLSAVRRDQWTQPSICPDWSVKDLADHVLGGNRFAVALLAGRTASDAHAEALQAGFDGDPLEAFQLSAAAQRGAFAVPAALETTVAHPAGEITGRTFLGFRVGEYLLHGWDLARSTGGDDTLDDNLVAAVWNAYAPLRSGMSPSGHFGRGPSGQLPDDAPLADRLLDMTGRRR